MATTVSGWPVIDSDDCRLWVIPGSDRKIRLRDGSAGFLLIHFALWWHEVIERLNIVGDLFDEWGHAVRPVRGQTSGYSNHAGGIAEDLNATRHPHKVPIYKTFTPKQVKKIRRRLRLYRGLIVWGGNWSPQYVDGMHAEIGGSLARCERLAKILTHTPRGRKILLANPGARRVIYS